MYRGQAFVERCMCEQPAVAPCASCGRARCALHLVRGLCDRCSQAVERELTAGAGRRWWFAWTLGVVGAVVPMVVHSAIGLPIGAVLGAASYVGLRWRARRTLIARLGPALSASKGELPAPSRDYEPAPERDRIEYPPIT